MSHQKRCATLYILFLILNSCSQNARQAYIPPGGEFSFVPPEHWVMREVPGFKYQFAFEQGNNGFAPNINVVESYAPFKLDDFVAGNLQALQQMSAEGGGLRVLKVLSQTEFTTDFKQSGVKVVTETEYYGKQLRQTFYLRLSIRSR